MSTAINMSDYRELCDNAYDTEQEIRERVTERLHGWARGIVRQAIERAIKHQRHTRCSAAQAQASGVRWAKSCAGGDVA